MAQDKHRRAAETHRAAMAHVDKLVEASTELRSIPKVARGIDSMMRGIAPRWDMQDRAQFSQATLERTGDLMGEIAVCELWKRNGRVIYDLNDDLANALYRSKMAKVPGDLFDRLPHINPMIVIPDPWPAGKGRGGLAEGYVRCIFIVGISGSGLCNSNDADRDGLALLFCYDVVDEETGEIIPGDFRDLIPLPMGRKTFTADEAIEYAEEWQGGSADGKDRNDAIKTFRPILQKAFAVLTYLCTDNRDVEQPPEWAMAQRKRKTGKGRRPARDPFWVRVGYYIGPKLHSALGQRAASADHSGIPIPSGVEYGPQHRAGHFKTVWIGKGKTNERTQSTTTWVEPYWTKLEDLPEGVDAPTQIVPVDAQRGDPLRRRDTIGR
jgi:hypothetical protein